MELKGVGPTYAAAKVVTVMTLAVAFFRISGIFLADAYPVRPAVFFRVGVRCVHQWGLQEFRTVNRFQ